MCHISIRTFIYIFCFQLMLLQFSAVFFQFFSRLCVFQQPKNKLLQIFWSQWYIFTCALFDFLQIYTKIDIKVIVITWWALSLRATKFSAWWTRSIPWLLMTWLLTSPGHQQPWYWRCKIHRLLSSMRKSTTCIILLSRNDTKHRNIFIYFLKIIQHPKGYKSL